jgi:phospholipid/cholesterol/gamma-HCH transport system substrate-binding protein
METRANYVLIGAFVLVAAAAAMLFAVWITQAPFNRSFNTYDVVFEGPVNGLSEGGEVRFNGIKVGEVRRLSLDRADPNRVIARINVNGETPVRTDSIAQLDFLGITGVTFIQIRAGTPNKPLLVSEGDNIPTIKTERTALDTLFQGGQDVLTMSSQTMANVNKLLSDENVASITSILQSVDAAAAKLAQDKGLMDSATSALRSVDRAATALESAAKSIDTAATTLNTDVAALAENANAAMTDLRPAISDARDALSRLNSTMYDVNTKLSPAATQALQGVSQVAGDLRALMMRIDSLASEIGEDPSRFVYQKPLPTE